MEWKYANQTMKQLMKLFYERTNALEQFEWNNTPENAFMVIPTEEDKKVLEKVIIEISVFLYAFAIATPEECVNDAKDSKELERFIMDELGIRELNPLLDKLLAYAIIILLHTVDDFSDVIANADAIESKLKLVFDAIDRVYVSESKGKTFANADSLEKVDTTNVEIGMVLKNYNALCSLLNEKPAPSGSNSRKAQKKRFDRYLKLEKGRGQKIVITDIYDEPLPEEDGRKSGNRNIYIKYIETILLKYIYYRKGQVCYATRNQLWSILGMINNCYKKISAKILRTEIEYSDVSDWELNQFYMRCNAKLNTILFTALNNLSNRSLIAYEVQTMIVVPDPEKGVSKHYVADDSEIRKILSVERSVLNAMNLESKSHAACLMKLSEFYDTVNRKLFELYGWERKYERLKIIFNEKDIKDAITKNEYELQMIYLNEIVIDAIDKNAQTVVDNRLKKALLEYDEYLSEWKANNWGKPPRMEEIGEIFTYPKYYVDIQRKLSQKFLSIKPTEEKKPVFDRELEELFANLGVE